MKRLVAATTVAVLGAALVGFSARAADVKPFQFEAGLSYTDTSEDIVETSVIGLGGIYAFESVHPGSAPIEEALFLARVPYAGLAVGFISGDADYGFPVDLDGTEIDVTAGYADNSTPLAVSFSYSSSGLNIKAPGTTGTGDISDLEVKVGAYAMPNLLVGLSYGTSGMSAEIGGFGTIIEMDMTSIGFVGKWVQRLGGGGGVNVEFGYSSQTAESPGSPDWEASIIDVGADYYINQFIGIGVGVELLSGDEVDDDSTTLKLRASYNAGTGLGVRVAWEKTSYEDETIEDDDELTISVVGRF